MEGQLSRDQIESDQIRVEEERLLAVKAQSAAHSEEAHQCDIGLEAVRQQKTTLWTHLQVCQQAEEAQRHREEEQSLVEIRMETDEIDIEMDMTIVEQRTLPKAGGSTEQEVYEHLVAFELNAIQWRFEALFYLATIVKRNKEAQERGDETRMPAQAYLRIWAYLGLKNLLTRHEVEKGTEDPNTSVAARYKAAERVHQTWLGQRMRVLKPCQSPSSSRSRVDQSKPPMARIRYERSLVEILFLNDYDENDFLVSGITVQPTRLGQ